MPASDTPLPVPSRLGRYELRAVLGRGGAGVVYDAVLLGLGGFRKRVALKVLAARHWQDERARDALQREARLGALLSHPHLVSIFDLGRQDDRWYLAMELVDGAPVSSLLGAVPLDPSAILEIGIATCAGLAHIHDLRVEGRPGGLVHRDIKPQNLLLDRNGTLKIADFGIATLASAVADRAGTPTWMAPEQQEGRADPRSDLFALGATLYALAARRAPFGVGEAALAASPRVETHLADPAFLHPVDAALPGLGAVVRRCLRLDPADRYPSAQALAADLRALRPRAGWSDLGALVDPEARDGSTRTSPPATPRTPPEAPGGRDDGLVGRDDQLAALRAIVEGGTRLVTLTGPGGVGKTRLAEALAARGLDGPPVWVGLGDAPATDGEVGLAHALGRALGVSLVQGDPVRQVAAAVAARGRAILFFDGVDAARDGLAAFLGALFDGAPRTRAVLTARGPLQIRGERVVPVRPLGVPDGVTLFLRRVAVPLPDDDRAALPTLVEALDGLPLAIELAAARARSLGVTILLDRLRDRFRLLVDPSRPGTSLRQALATSFAMLRPWEARALAELSVFPRDFALEAAEAVVRLDAWPEAPWALDVLSTLLDASLIRLDRASGRFALLHSVRDFAAEALDPGLRRAAEIRHGEHYAQLGSPEVDEALRRRRPDLVRRVEAELDNLRLAAERAVARGDALVAERAAQAAAAVYLHRGPFSLGLALLDRVLALPDLRIRHHLLVQRWWTLRIVGRASEGARDLDEAERLGTDLGDPSAELAARAFRTVSLDAAAATAALRGVLADAQRLGDVDGEIRASSMLGSRLLDRGDLRGARSALEAARSLATRAGDGRGAALTTMRLGGVDLAEGLFRDALRRLEEAERTAREIGDETTAATARENRAVVLAEAGHLPAATALFEETLGQFRAVGNRWGETNTLLNLGKTAQRTGRLSEARAHLEEGAALARVSGWRAFEGRAEGRLGLLEAHLGRREAADLRFVRSAALLQAAGLPREAAMAEACRRLSAIGAGEATPDGLDEGIAAVEPREQPELWTDLGHLRLDRDEVSEASAAHARGRAALERHPDHRRTASRVGVLAARLAVREGDLPRAARLLDDADADLTEDWQRVRLLQARAERWLAQAEPGRAAAAVRDLRAAVDRAGFGAPHPLRAVIDRLAARARP